MLIASCVRKVTSWHKNAFRIIGPLWETGPPLRASHDGPVMMKPILRTYRMFKHNFESEKYLHNVLDDRYRTAIAKLRTSSHVLEIERGRHAKPKIATHLRTCTVCHTIEDEEHFVTACEINESERKELHRKIENIYPLFKNMNERQMFLYLMSNKDRQVQKWFGKFIYHSFITRNHRVLLNVK